MRNRGFFSTEAVKTALLTVCTFLSVASVAQNARAAGAGRPVTVSGKVYVDQNQNGQWDQGEAPLSKIKITDGFTFVLSGADGSFSMRPHPEARFIYVCTPAFYDPSGKFYRPLPLSGNADFGLIHRPNQSPTFIQTADNEENIYREWMDELKAYIRNEQPAFVITTGDICYEKGLRMHAREFTTEKLGTRTLYSSGNHDLLAYGKYGEALFEELFGPCWYSFDVANTHFVVFPMLFGDNPTGFTARQIFNWIDNDLKLLAPGQKVVICSHDLFLKENEGVPMLVFRTDTLSLANYPIDSYIYGHRHNQISQTLPGSAISTYGTGTANKGARDHSPALYRLFSLQSDGSIRSQTRYSLQNALLQPHAGASPGPQSITVNAYHTPSDIHSVLIEGQGAPIALQKCSDWSWSTAGEITLSPGQPLQVVAAANDGSRFVAPMIPSDRLVWSQALGGMSTIYPPIFADNTLFIALHDDAMGKGNHICAIDPGSGALFWDFHTSNAVKSSIAYDNGTLLACDVTGNLYALDAKTGTQRWQRRMLSFAPNTFQQGVVARNGVAYVCSGNTSAAVLISDGSILWDHQLSPGNHQHLGLHDDLPEPAAFRNPLAHPLRPEH